MIKIHILESVLNEYEKECEYSLQIKKKIGSGSYGTVYDIGNYHVIKLFHNSTYETTILEERDCIIPYQSENRELSLYFRMIRNPLENHIRNYIIPPLVIGYIKEDIQILNQVYKNGSYYVIMPICYPFYKYHMVKKNDMNKRDFILEFMYKLLHASLYLENEYNIVHLDIKMNNIMYLMNPNYRRFEERNDDENNSRKHSFLILLDFSLLKTCSTRRFELDDIDIKNGITKYYLWDTQDENFQIRHVPSYSIGVNIIEILFGKEVVNKLPNRRICEKYIRKIYENYEDIAFICKKMLIDKVSTLECYTYVKTLYELQE
jgi:hypothetical protein